MHGKLNRKAFSHRSGHSAASTKRTMSVRHLDLYVTQLIIYLGIRVYCYALPQVI